MLFFNIIIIFSRKFWEPMHVTNASARAQNFRLVVLYPFLKKIHFIKTTVFDPKLVPSEVYFPRNVYTHFSFYHLWTQMYRNRLYWASPWRIDKYCIDKVFYWQVLYWQVLIERCLYSRVPGLNPGRSSRFSGHYSLIRVFPVSP